MYILIEEYQYAFDDVSHVLAGLGLLHDAERRVSVSYVGYYYSPELKDCVFILPKVLLEGKTGEEKVFGHIEPRDLIHAEQCKQLTAQEHQFIYGLAVWIYRAISVFKEHEYDRQGGKKRKPSIVLHKQAPMLGHSRRRKSNTFLDVLLALLQWNKDNQQFVMFVVKNLHAGFNKINWNRTIAKSASVVQQSGTGSRQEVFYAQPVNKRRQVNFDEELLIIFYSILNHIHEQYGFPVAINVNFPLITGKRFERYMNGYGKTRLWQIKYKYYSDKSLELWHLCYAFFERPYSINLNVDQREYLLVKSFHVVFEAIIDELIAGDQQLPKGLRDQEDGKVVDHLYQYHELTNDDEDENIYYIGDSKYYKRGRELPSESVYKQFTYARNVIQWNLDLFNDGKVAEQAGHAKLRDDATEGYNVIPNFFISAQQNLLTEEDDIHLATDRTPYYISRQFENRLFDRDTFLLAHYDVNFLFVLALYGRNNASAKRQWREKVRQMFRQEIQEMLRGHFLFYAMTAHEDVEPESYIQQHFQTLLGKVYQPFDHRGSQQYFSLALRNPEKITCKDKLRERQLREQINEENAAVLFQLRQSFHVVACTLGQDPRPMLPEVEPRPHVDVPQRLLTQHYLENYPDTSFLIGGFRREQTVWMFGREGGKRDDAYNVRIGREVEGGVVKSRNEIKHAKFVLLYEFGQESSGIYKAFRVKNIGEMTREQMLRTGYQNPKHDRYLCYFFEEEVNLGQFDIEKIINADRIRFGVETWKNKDAREEYPEGRPVYMTGRELIKYRK